MRHFIAYHNSKRTGHSAADSDPRSSQYVKRPVSPDVIGDIVWIVAGEGDSPKRFILSSWFQIDQVRPSDVADFKHILQGDRAGSFHPDPPSLNDLDWFPAFFEWTGHFSFGFRQIPQRNVIDELCRLANEAGIPQTA